MSEDIKKYKQLLESSYQMDMSEQAHDVHDPAQAAELLHHMFGAGGVDKHTLKDVLMGHKNDAKWALETLNHLENLVK